MKKKINLTKTPVLQFLFFKILFKKNEANKEKNEKFQRKDEKKTSQIVAKPFPLKKSGSQQSNIASKSVKTKLNDSITSKSLRNIMKQQKNNNNISDQLSKKTDLFQYKFKEYSLI